MVADRYVPCYTIAGSEAGLGKLIQAASTSDEVFQLIDSELGSDYEQ